MTLSNTRKTALSHRRMTSVFLGTPSSRYYGNKRKKDLGRTRQAIMYTEDIPIFVLTLKSADLRLIGNAGQWMFNSLCAILD